MSSRLGPRAIREYTEVQRIPSTLQQIVDYYFADFRTIECAKSSELMKCDLLIAIRALVLSYFGINNKQPRILRLHNCYI